MNALLALTPAVTTSLAYPHLETRADCVKNFVADGEEDIKVGKDAPRVAAMSSEIGPPAWPFNIRRFAGAQGAVRTSVTVWVRTSVILLPTCTCLILY
jgi:hypothetical protein